VQEKELGEAGEGVSAEAAENFIEGKRIGERIKYLRQRKHMGLVELGKYTGLSASFLSQLETGRVVPTLRNLARIAMVFSKDLSYFFEPERPELFRIVRATADQPIAPYVAEFLPVKEGRQAKAHRHTGNEFLYVLNGCMQLAHDGQVEQLASGDAVFFNAEAVHSYESIGDMACTALILSMPEALRGAHTGSRVPLSKAKSSVKK
jgi:transcriptional regulator with XRE-family HTH domain